MGHFVKAMMAVYSGDFITNVRPPRRENDAFVRESNTNRQRQKSHVSSWSKYADSIAERR